MRFKDILFWFFILIAIMGLSGISIGSKNRLKRAEVLLLQIEKQDAEVKNLLNNLDRAVGIKCKEAKYSLELAEENGFCPCEL